MKFYEMKDPYFALIAAEDEKQCLKLYNDLVCEVEDEKEFFEEMKTIDKYEALKMLAESFSEDGVKTGVEEAFIQLENLEGNGELLLIDGGLLQEEQPLLISLKVYKEGFNEKIRIGDSLEYAGYKYIIIRILEIKKLYFSKSIRLEIDVLAQKVGEPTNCNEYKKQAQLIDR